MCNMSLCNPTGFYWIYLLRFLLSRIDYLLNCYFFHCDFCYRVGLLLAIKLLYLHLPRCGFGLDSMTLLQCGVTQNSKIFLSVKESSSVERPLITTDKSDTSSSDGASRLDLDSLLLSLLSKHFTPSDAERVTDEFKRVSNCRIFYVVICHFLIKLVSYDLSSDLEYSSGKTI